MVGLFGDSCFEFANAIERFGGVAIAKDSQLFGLCFSLYFFHPPTIDEDPLHILSNVGGYNISQILNYI